MTRRPRPPVRPASRGSAVSRSARRSKAARARRKAQWERARWLTVAVLTPVVLLLCLLVSLDRIFTPTSSVAVVAIVLVGYALVGYLLCLVGVLVLRHRTARGARSRRWWTGAALLAATGLVLHAAWAAPAFVGSHPSREPTLTVLQLNTRFGNAAPDQVVQLATSRQADVVVLEELDPRVAARFVDAGLGTLLPHRSGDAHDGTMVFSRWPLRQARQLPVSKGAVRVRVAAPRPFWLLALHTTQPMVSTTTWLRDLRVARRAVARQHGPGLVVGDFNATLNHGPMRDLLGEDLADAAQAANSGFQPTWPSDDVARVLGVPVPISLVTLDHVLVTRQFGVVTTRTLTVSGTDHKALVASLVR